MHERRFGGHDPWPAGPMVARPWLMEQSCSEAVILHRRLSAAVAAGFMPPGTEPDVFGGSSGVGLIGFRMSEVRPSQVLPVPYTGSSFAVRPERSVQADNELSLELTARSGAHTRFAGRTFFLSVSHRPWPLHPAELVHLDDGLLGAAGLEVGGPPESVLFSPGVDTVFGTPWRVPVS